VNSKYPGVKVTLIRRYEIDRRRRENRGVEGVVFGEGLPLTINGLGERRELPKRPPTILVYLGPEVQR